MSSTTGRAVTSEDSYCFLRVSIAGRPPQRIVIQLFRETVPKTCQNFATLIAASGTTSPSKPLPTYRGSIFHRIVPNFMIQGGDFENFNGTGGHGVLPSNNARTFPDESFAIPHDKAGIVSMANKGKDTNGSQFFITLQQTPHLNKKHVAFGQVMEGMDVVQSMATDVELEGQRPTALQKIVIVDCGLGRGDENNDGNSNDDNSQELVAKEKRKERRKKKKKKHSKKHRRRHKDQDEDGSSSDDSNRDNKRRRKDKHKKKKHGRKRKDRYSSSGSGGCSSTSSEDSDRHRKKRRR